MEIISSVHNSLIKEANKLKQRKYREERSRFLIEGVRLAEEALKAGALETVFYNENLAETARGRALLQKLLEMPVFQGMLQQVTPQVLKTLAETDSPQGIVGIARKGIKPLDQLHLREESLVLIADAIQDPGNLGAMIRTAWCADAEAVICLPQTVDPYNGKTVRSSMGGIFNINIITGIEWEVLLTWCRKERMQTVAGSLKGQKHFTPAYLPRVALIIGNEGQGLIHVRPEQVDASVTIPLARGAESLNAAVACGIIMYEIIRQRGLFH